jgi:hypothetical protein
MAANKRQIGISVFTTETRKQYLEHPGTLGHDRKVHCLKPGDIILLYDLTSKEVFGIGILSVILNGKIYTERSLIDQELYTKEYNKYNKYEIGVKAFMIEPVLKEAINAECGLDITTPFLRGHVVSFKLVNPAITPWVNRVLAELFIAQHM